MIKCKTCGECKEYTANGWRCRGCEPSLLAHTIEPPFSKNFIEAVRTMQHAVHENAKEHGWWDEPREDGTIAMLIVTEIAEAIEALRMGEGKPSEKIPNFSKEEEELADAVIRILDFAGRKNYRLGAAILAKHAYNRTRPRMHGNKLF